MKNKTTSYTVLAMCRNSLNKKAIFSWVMPGFIVSLLLISYTSWAGNWHIIPIRLDFDQRNRSGVVTVTNEADSSLHMNVQAFEWTQDSDGKDSYLPTDDLIYFPKALSIGPKESRVIRSGIKIPNPNREKAYRLFVKEVPESTASANTVSIALQFGVPIFSRPLNEVVQGKITQSPLQDGQIKIVIENSGNVHFRVKTIHVVGKDATGKEVFAHDLDGWYILNGHSRTYSASVAPDTCQLIATMEVQATADRISLNSKIDVDPAMCVSQ